MVRRWPRVVGLLAVGLFAGAACAPPAAAQQAVSPAEFLAGLPAPLAPPPHPTDTGKLVIYDPLFVAKSDNDRGCSPGFSCRLQLLGVIQNNGAVELRATAFTW